MSQRSLRFALLPLLLAGGLCSGCGARITLTPEKDVVGVSRSIMVKAESTSEEDTNFFWKSSDTSILRVGGGGRGSAIWGVAPGVAEIVVEGAESGAVGRVSLTVVPEEELPEEIAKRSPGGQLFHAAETRDMETVIALLDQGVDPDYRALHAANMPVLSAAVRARQLTIIKYLLAAGADANLTDDHGLTPLMHAASIGHRGTIDALLDGGAKTNLTSKDGRSVLDCAFENGQGQAFAQLAEAGAKKTKSDGAKEWLKRNRRFVNAGRNARIMAFLWLILFITALWAPSLHRLLARRRRYHKTVAGDETVYVETERVTQVVRRRIRECPGEPPAHERVPEGDVFEPSAETETHSHTEFHELWHAPYRTYKRWVNYLRLCALTVLSVPMFIVWLAVAHNRYSRIPPFAWLPRGGDAIFFIAIAAMAVPPLLFLASIVALVRLQLAKPTSRQQFVALAAGAATLVGLAGLAFLAFQAAVSLGG